MDQLTICRVCSKRVATSAIKCPHCGASLLTAKRLGTAMLVSAILIAGAAWAFAHFVFGV